MYLYFQNQLKALNLGKALKTKKSDAPSSQRSKGEKDVIDGSEQGGNLDDNGNLKNIQVYIFIRSERISYQIIIINDLSVLTSHY